MADKMMRICGRTPTEKAKAIGVDEKGTVLVKRVWGSTKTALVIDKNVASGGQIRDASMHNTLGSEFDAREYGFVSFRVNNTLDSDVTFYLYDDDETNTAYLTDMKGEYPQFTVKKNTKAIITPDDLPILNYLQFVKLRLKATTTPTTGYLTIWVVAKR